MCVCENFFFIVRALKLGGIFYVESEVMLSLYASHPASGMAPGTVHACG